MPLRHRYARMNKRADELQDNRTVPMKSEAAGGVSSNPGPLLPFWAAAVAAIVSGPIVDAGFPGQSLWPLALVGVACVLVALVGRGFWTGTVVGFAAGMSFYLTHIVWSALYLGPLPWIALSVLQSLIYGVAGGAIALAYRWVPAAWPTRASRILLLPAVVGGLWVAREDVAGSWPYGGFAWGRIAYSQSAGPFAEIVSWVGVSGLSFVLVATVALLLQFGREAGTRPQLRMAAGWAIITALALVPLWPGVSDRSVRIAAVQGNGAAGYFSERQPGDLLRAQVDATRPIRNEKVDLVVWPENATDLDPLTSPEARDALDRLTREMNAPLILGAITQRAGLLFNSTLLWTPGSGVQDLYDKKHPVPFGEYVPNREFWQRLAPELIGLIQRDYEIGTRDGVLRTSVLSAGSAICFDISDDRVIRSLVDDGAEIILAQTNNADFGRTDESVQQLAIARMRALETGRAVVNISTVGTSAMIAPDGRTLAQLPTFTTGTMIEDVPVMRGRTPAMAIGGLLALCVAFGSVAILGASRLVLRTSGNSTRP